ncbi:hypothetical protein CPB86DRAFT_875799 [Serendipita vermifera]|nr:hypothetical protein CPB86DRAFT_875799 [Serendipita vermifera]
MYWPQRLSMSWDPSRLPNLDSVLPPGFKDAICDAIAFCGHAIINGSDSIYLDEASQKLPPRQLSINLSMKFPVWEGDLTVADSIFDDEHSKALEGDNTLLSATVCTNEYARTLLQLWSVYSRVALIRYYLGLAPETDEEIFGHGTRDGFRRRLSEPEYLAEHFDLDTDRLVMDTHNRTLDLLHPIAIQEDDQGNLPSFQDLSGSRLVHKSIKPSSMLENQATSLSESSISQSTVVNQRADTGNVPRSTTIRNAKTKATQNVENLLGKEMQMSE